MATSQRKQGIAAPAASPATPLIGLSGGNIVGVDPTTGAVTTITAVTGLLGMQLGAEASVNNHLYFNGQTATGALLYALDLGTGQLTSVAATMRTFVADDTTGLLVGFASASLSTVVSVDPTTGTTTQIATIPGLTNVQLGGEAAVNGSLYFNGVSAAGTRLYTVDITTGQVSSVTSTINSFVADSATGKLVGFGTNLANGIVSVDPTTGVTTQIATIAGLTSVNAAAEAASNGLFYFEGVTASGTQLYSVNIATGQVTSTATTAANFVAVDPPTTQQIFTREGGELSFLALLADAAYHLDPSEHTGSGINNAGGTAADAAFAKVRSDLQMLTATDLPSLAPSVVANANFPNLGLETDGIYLNQNAAAVVGRSSDSLFISFRGTNDGTATGLLSFLTGIGSPTPDQSDWKNEGAYYALFQQFIAAIKAYVVANGIAHVYVTGHSLGAAMAQQFMAQTPNTAATQYEAITFGDIGYAGGTITDRRIKNFLIDGEAANVLNGNGVHSILVPTLASNPVSGPEYIIQNAEAESFSASTWVSDLHSPALQVAVADFLDKQAASLPLPAVGASSSTHINIALDLVETGSDWTVGFSQGGLAEQGSAANDYFIGDRGTNSIDGGAGYDRAYYQVASTAVVIGHNGGGATTITGNNLTETLTNIELVHFTDRSVVLREMARTDITGSGTSGMILQSGGVVVDWVLGGGAYQTGSVLTSGASGYTVGGAGDFNGDGTADIVLQAGGTVVDWILSNGAYQTGNVLTTGAAGYAVKGTGDFNGDGTADVLLQSGGIVVDWIMGDGQYQSGNVITTGAAGYSVVGTGDFNGDGTTDVLLQSGGTVVDWLMSDGHYQSGHVLTTAATGYTVVGAGDFNGDGTTDVVLQNSTGTVVDWILQNGVYQSGSVITTGATGFTVVGTGDYNGDGTADIALQSGGTIVDWSMHNGLYQSGRVVTTGATGFEVKA